MRVLFVEASSGGVVGGSLTGLYHAIRGLVPRRHQIAMVLYEKKELEADLERLGVPVWHVSRSRLPKEHALQHLPAYRAAFASSSLRNARYGARRALSTLIEDLPAALRLVPILRRFRPDVVHAGNGVRANFDVLLACWMVKVPVVCHVKGFEKYTARERWVARHASALLCMTEAVRQHCRAQGIEHPHSVVIYDAIDERDFQPKRPAAEVRRELGFDSGVFLAGVVGNIQEWKGQKVFVSAMARLRERVPGARGVLVGGIHRAGQRYFEEIRDLIAQERLDGHVVVTGFRSDVADWMAALDTLVHSSVRPEPFGRVILEGMLLGKPVVATAAGGVPELIEPEKTGFLVPPGDVEALTECLARLAGNEGLRRNVGSAAQQWARERFSLQRHVSELEQLYEAVTKGRHAA